MVRTLFSLALFILMTATMASAAPQKKPVDSAPIPVKSIAPQLPEAQVELDGKPLLAIKAKVLSFSPEDRAKAVSSRLAKLIKDPLFNAESLKVMDSETTTDIVAGDTILMSVTEADAQAEGKPRLALAEEYAAKIRAAVVAHNKAYSMRTILFLSLIHI